MSIAATLHAESPGDHQGELYVAILLTVLGPVITIAVALHGMERLGDRFDDVQKDSDHRALALDLKFGVTDFNGWQTAYGYDDGASRGRFLHRCACSAVTWPWRPPSSRIEASAACWRS